MGYTTKFTGALKLSRPLTLAQAKQILEANEDPDSIKQPPIKGYMQWVPTSTLDGIVWDGGEKFYDYTAWLQWLVDLLSSWGVVATGELSWSGENTGDHGILQVDSGRVTAKPSGHPTERAKPLTMDMLGRMALEQATGGDSQ